MFIVTCVLLTNTLYFNGVYNAAVIPSYPDIVFETNTCLLAASTDLAFM